MMPGSYTGFSGKGGMGGQVNVVRETQACTP